MGESKTRVVGQIIFEVILISLIGISLAMFTGRSLGQVMSNQMVLTQKHQTRMPITISCLVLLLKVL